ncbi:hypothetical protein [Candidatus Vampirococcus lugosii]|uniref:Fibronectin type-III domain-containing protein n=1 Tax=Candidatus Vampirococcus lugosii TaxID=2789015 RepID=A0ABS5QLJ3_9BACT|nr:hypothetical protein [Candidatus Vampirococcus lugosii]MBS8121596.1 hypothetical protein [Candidatus Vampirococcus lugosii]
MSKKLISLFIIMLGIFPLFTFSQDDLGDDTWGDDTWGDDTWGDEDIGEGLGDDTWGDGNDDWGDDDWGDDGWGDDAWGYSSNDTVELIEAKENSLILEIPLIEDANANTIFNYDVYYSTESDSINANREEVVGIDPNNNEVEINGLVSNTDYYVYVVPINTEGTEGTESEEFMFTTSEEVDDWGDDGWGDDSGDEDLGDDDTNHGAGDDSSKLKPSYTKEQGDIEITWTPIESADKVEVYLRHNDDSDFSRIGEANSSHGKFDIIVTRNGNYHVKLVPVNDMGEPVGDETTLTIKDINVDDKEPEIGDVPEVGPSLNILILFILLASFGYVYHRYRTNLQ